MKFIRLAAAAALATVALGTAAADAAVNVTINQVGSDVVANVTGTLNTAGLTSAGLFGDNNGVRGNGGYIGFGPEGSLVTGYSGFSGPTAWGPGTTYTSATSTTSGLFAFNAGNFSSGFAFVATDYVSGSALSASTTFANATLASLGLAAGQYAYTSTADTVTINVGPSGPAVPEPATWAMMIGGFGAIGGALRRRRADRTALRLA